MKPLFPCLQNLINLSCLKLVHGNLQDSDCSFIAELNPNGIKVIIWTTNEAFYNSYLCNCNPLLAKGGICDPLVNTAWSLPVHILHPTLCHHWSGCTTTHHPLLLDLVVWSQKKTKGKLNTLSHTHTA